MNQTAIKKAIEDISGYKIFGKTIDINFVIVLLELLMEQEKEQIKQAYTNGREDESSSSGLFGRTSDQYYDSLFNPLKS